MLLTPPPTSYFVALVHVLPEIGACLPHSTCSLDKHCGPPFAMLAEPRPVLPLVKEETARLKWFY